MRPALLLVFAILISSLALAQHNFAEAERLIDSGIACSKLSDEQLEAIGEFYMEQMHPGEAHEIMDNMMGGEGSESLKQVHINMAKRLYCNENIYVGYGMMSGSMMGMMNTGMMGYSYGYSNLLWLLIIALLFLAVWIAYNYGVRKDNPLEILKKRYARGEITRKQFEEMKKKLE